MMQPMSSPVMGRYVALLDCAMLFITRSASSVHLSVQCRYRTASKRLQIVKLFWHSGKGIILLFEPTAVMKFQVEPLSGGLKCTWVEKFSKYCLADQSVSVPMTLSDIEGRNAKCQTFPYDLRNYAPIIWTRATKFGTKTVRLVGKGRVSNGLDTPHPKKRGTVLKNLGPTMNP